MGHGDYGHEQLWNAAVTESDQCIFFVYSPHSNRRRTGRPVFSILSRNMTASRAVWILRHGIPPNSMNVLHTCNEGSGESGCINVNHMYLGTQEENIRDMVCAGRHPNASLRPEDIPEIRRLGEIGFRNGRGSNVREIADRYGVAPRTIRDVLTGKSWKHV